MCPVRNKCYWRVPGIGRPLINDFPSSPPYTTPTICFLRHETSKQKMMEGKKQFLTKKSILMILSCPTLEIFKFPIGRIELLSEENIKMVQILIQMSARDTFGNCRYCSFSFKLKVLLVLIQLSS